MTATQLPTPTFETFTPVEEVHPYRPYVETLIEKGPDEIAVVIVATEAEANQFVLDMQKAARQLDKSARKRILTPELDAKGKETGKIKVGVSVGNKITRNRKPKNGDAAETETE